MKHLRVAAIAAFALVVTTAFSQTINLSPKDIGGKQTPSVKQSHQGASLYTPNHSNATTTSSTKSTPSSPAPQTSQPTKTSAHPPVGSTASATPDNSSSSVVPDINWPVTVSGIAVVLLLGGWLWNRNKPAAVAPAPPTSASTPPSTQTSGSTDPTQSSR